MKIVLDTNLLLSCISPKSSTHWLYEALFEGKFTLCVTTEILDEYAEIIEWGFRNRGREVADNVLEALIHSPFTERESRVAPTATWPKNWNGWAYPSPTLSSASSPRSTGRIRAMRWLSKFKSKAADSVL